MLGIEKTENFKRKIQEVYYSPNTGDKVKFINKELVRTKQRNEAYCRCSDSRSNQRKNKSRQKNKQK